MGYAAAGLCGSVIHTFFLHKDVLFKMTGKAYLRSQEKANKSA